MRNRDSPSLPTNRKTQNRRRFLKKAEMQWQKNGQFKKGLHWKNRYVRGEKQRLDGEGWAR